MVPIFMLIEGSSTATCVIAKFEEEETSIFCTEINMINISNLPAKVGPLVVAFPPPLALKESFSGPDFGQNFPLFSRVMRVKLSIITAVR